jgi:hypothetical protein
MNRIKVLLFRVVVVVLVTFWLSSCRTARNLPTIAIKPIGTGKLLKRIEQNAFDYKNFTIKRISCQFSNNGKRTTFMVNLKALKDKKILVSISKMKIPVARVLLTPDSVIYVNYIDHNYFIDDYSYLSSFLNIDLDFETIQSIISNNAFSYRNDAKNRDFKTFDSFVEDGLYVLQSEKTKKIFKMEKKANTEKVKRRLKRLGNEALILQKMYFNPANFALLKLIISDKTNNRTMNMDFSNFVEVHGKDYPGSIAMNFNSEQSKVQLKVKMSGFYTDKISSFKIKIPKKYEQIKVN